MDEKILIMQAYRRSDPTRLVSWYARPDSAWLLPEETRSQARNFGDMEYPIIGVWTDDPHVLDRSTNQWTPEAFYDPMFVDEGIARNIKLYLGRQLSSLDSLGSSPATQWMACADTVLLAFGQDYWHKRTDNDMNKIEVMFASLKALRAHLRQQQSV